MKRTNLKNLLYIIIIISFVAASLGMKVNTVAYAQSEDPATTTDVPVTEEPPVVEVTQTLEPTATPTPEITETTIPTEITPTPEPTTTPEVISPNLAPFTPDGWSAPFVIVSKSESGETVELYTGQDTLIDFAFVNNGGDTLTPFAVSLYLDDQEVQRWTVDSLLSGQTFVQSDVLLPGSVDAGAHRVAVVADVDNVIAESIEDDNSWSQPVEFLKTETTETEQTPIFDDMLFAPDAPISMMSSTGSSAPGISNTSDYMIGSVAVGIVFPESTGSGENWTTSRRDQVVSKIQSGLSWWAQQASANGVPLSFQYDIQYTVPTTYEPITMSSVDDGLWVDQVMSNMGYSGSDKFGKTRNYLNTLRSQKGTDWAFVIFVVDSLNDADGKFSNGRFAYAYLGGPYMVVTYDNNGWGIANMDRVSAHETGHIFRAADNYYQEGYGGCTDPTVKYGYLGIANSNCQYNNPGAQTNVIMNDNSWNLHWTTAQQVGWRDSDTNGRMDPVDTKPKINMGLYSPDPATVSQLTFTGYAYDDAFPRTSCALPYCVAQNITINKIASVQYRINGGAWINAIPTDGYFNLDYEQFTFTTSVLANGTYLIEVQTLELSWGGHSNHLE